MGRCAEDQTACKLTLKEPRKQMKSGCHTGLASISGLLLQRLMPRLNGRPSRCGAAFHRRSIESNPRGCVLLPGLLLFLPHKNTNTTSASSCNRATGLTPRKFRSACASNLIAAWVPKLSHKSIQCMHLNRARDDIGRLNNLLPHNKRKKIKVLRTQCRTIDDAVNKRYKIDLIA